MSVMIPVRGVAVRVLLIVASTLASAAGCTVSGSASPICEIRVTYEGRTYHAVANIDFTVGEELGTAVNPPCNDQGRRTEERATETTAYRVEGLDPDIAIAVGGTSDDAVLMTVRVNKSLPPAVEKLRDRP